MMNNTSRREIKSPYARLGLIVRLLYLVGAFLYACCTGFGRFRKKAVVVLCYHGVDSRQRASFLWQVRRIADRAVPVNSLEDSLKTSHDRRPSICLTFDDAFVNLCDNVFPILNDLHVPATVFVVTENIGIPPRWVSEKDPASMRGATMSWEQIEMMARNKLFTFGSHTQTHPRITHLSSESIQTELKNSRKTLQDRLHTPLEDFAFPHGDYDEKSLCLAREAGYRRIFTIDVIPFRVANDDCTIGRFSMTPDLWKLEFLLTCAGAYEWLYPLRLFLRKIRYWKKNTKESS
jgi:peptidoglycan/xylan/chitin deacetylase (PgdA/CDA1 family)